MKIKKITLTLPSTICILSLFLVSCIDLDKPVDPELDRELKALEQYIKDNNITVEPTQSGLYYIEQVEGTGEQPLENDTVIIHYIGSLLDGTIIDTSYEEIAKENDIYNEEINYGPFEFVYGTPTIIAGVQVGVALMKEGGKARLIFSSLLGFGARYYTNIPPYSSLIFDVELLEVRKGPDY